MGVAPTTAAPATRAGKLSVMDLLRPIVIMGLRSGVRSDAPSGARDAPSGARGGVRRAAAQARQRERRSIVSSARAGPKLCRDSDAGNCVSLACVQAARQALLAGALFASVLHAASLGKTGDLYLALKLGPWPAETRRTRGTV